VVKIVKVFGPSSYKGGKVEAVGLLEMLVNTSNTMYKPRRSTSEPSMLWKLQLS